MGDTYANARSMVFRRHIGVGSAGVSPATSALGKAASITLIFLFLAAAVLVLVPLILLAAVIFLSVFAFLRARQFLAGVLTGSLWRQDGRRNVRVRIPDAAE